MNSGYIPVIFQNAIFALSLFATTASKKARNRAGYYSLFSKPWSQKSSRTKPSILKDHGYKCWVSAVLMAIVVSAQAVELRPIQVDITDKSSLQRGAKWFMNYCAGCHSLRYLRYNRMANDLDITTAGGNIDKTLLKNNLIFTRATISDPIQISMSESDARQWFGRVPPDLSLTGRERGPSWIYTYLTGFYPDHTRPFGSNNVLINNVSMPNVFYPLSKTMSKQELNQAITDIVTFLTYAAEPNQTSRKHIGYFVIFGLLVLLGLVYLNARSTLAKH